mgnify:CR=1 FL=1
MAEAGEQAPQATAADLPRAQAARLSREVLGGGSHPALAFVICSSVFAVRALGPVESICVFPRYTFSCARKKAAAHARQQVAEMEAHWSAPARLPA